MANRRAACLTSAVGQGVCQGGKKGGEPDNHRLFTRIAKMANLYQYCTPSGGYRWFPKAWIREKR